MSNAGTIKTLTNMGKIIGGNGGAVRRRISERRAGVAGGDGIVNSGAITTLANGAAIDGRHSHRSTPAKRPPAPA